MTIIKTSKLTGAALDWSVAKCEGFQVEHNYIFTSEHLFSGWWQGGPDYWQRLNSYSTDWAKGGPIIERERFARITLNVANQYTASIRKNIHYIDLDGDEAVRLAWVHGTGSTPLIAAMRCYVASKLGDEVEVPDQLA